MFYPDPELDRDYFDNPDYLDEIRFGGDPRDDEEIKESIYGGWFDSEDEGWEQALEGAPLPEYADVE